MATRTLKCSMVVMTGTTNPRVFFGCYALQQIPVPNRVLHSSCQCTFGLWHWWYLIAILNGESTSFRGTPSLDKSICRKMGGSMNQNTLITGGVPRYGEHNLCTKDGYCLAYRHMSSGWLTRAKHQHLNSLMTPIKTCSMAATSGIKRGRVLASWNSLHRVTHVTHIDGTGETAWWGSKTVHPAVGRPPKKFT